MEKDGKPIIVTSQPAIKGELPTQQALDELMLGKGYENLADCYFPISSGLTAGGSTRPL